MKQRLTPLQEKFCLKYFQLGNGTEAIIQAGYSPKGANKQAYIVLCKPHVQARLAQLWLKTESEAVMTVQERKERLSEIARANLIDFVDDEGNIDLDKEHNVAISEVVIEDWRGGKDGRATSRNKRLKVHNPMQAIDLLNKMEKMYGDTEVNIDNRKVVFQIGKGYADDKLDLPADK